MSAGGMRSILYLVALRPEPITRSGVSVSLRSLSSMALRGLAASSQPSFMMRNTSSCMTSFQYVHELLVHVVLVEQRQPA